MLDAFWFDFKTRPAGEKVTLGKEDVGINKNQPT